MEHDDIEQALTDEIDALLRQAEPSPRFRARVLQRIDAESESAGRTMWLALIPAAAAIALLVGAVLPWLRIPADDSVVVSEKSVAAPVAPVPRPIADPSQSAHAPDRRTSLREAFTPPPQPSDVLISPDDAAAFEVFISSVESGRLRADMFESPDEWADLFEPSGADDNRPAVIEPLRLEPLATIPPLKEAEL